MLVVGIDPGSQRTGWGMVAEESGMLRLIDCGVIRTSAADAFCERLAAIYHALSRELARYQPQEGCIEQVFTARNAQTALKLGQARGVAVAACAAHGCPVYDYEPCAVKKAVVGVGRAEKEQVAFMVKRMLNLGAVDLALDTTDALGVAICHLSQARLRRMAARAAHQVARETV